METLGAYKLGKIIGQGAMATVYAAERNGCAIAVKCLHPQFAAHQEQVSLFEAEGVLAARFEHPNLVRASDAGVVEDHYYIAMELVRGPNLGQSLHASRPPNPVTAARIGRSLCRGLKPLHDDGIVHCDVNPTNILIGPSGEVKLTDFGVATEAGRAQPEVRGTYGYMAPEQARGGPLDPRTDIFAIGILLWEMWAGRRLFRREQPYLTLAAAVEEDAPLLDDADLNAIAQRALAKNPDDRYQSCADLGQALKELAQSRDDDTGKR